MRLFIAIELPQTLQNEIAHFIEPLRKQVRGARWIPLQNLHLTLKFLGEVPEIDILKIKNCMEEVIREENFQPFKLQFSKIGGFPTLKSPRVIWLGVSIGEEVLSKITSSLEGSLELLGYPKKDRPYQAHLSLGKVKDPKQFWGVEKFELIHKTSFAGFSVGVISLLQSFLGRDGASYEKVYEVKL
ncbi:MAG: RNA 2',3'-cyclic phosphodiesterase [Chlamydiae bacterium]|nr:RNA 2',3'-cyclic phosphodiesterase [Chlamydiota bacterium]MBI3276485.1 RNA 2',3'-cyclic phosphodiesterase [Chlamydiota bacterium]